MKTLRKIEDFFLLPASPKPLAALRVGLGLVLITQALVLRTSMEAFFSGDGLIQGELAKAFMEPGMPRISWIVRALAPLHLTELSCIHWVCGTYLAGLIAMVFGILGRPVVALCWFLHWMLMNTGQTTNYGVDLYAQVLLFYLIFFPSSWPSPSVSAPDSLARLGLRLIQLQLCITYLFSAIEKATGPQWWNGELLWRALNLPEYRQFDMFWLANHPWLPQILGLGSLVLEFGYSVFIWPKRTRKLWVFGIVSLHLGIAVFLGLGLFGVLMAVMTLAVFGLSAEPASQFLERPILLFDGPCDLCNRSVAFVSKRDTSGQIALTSLQSVAGQALLVKHRLPVQDFTSLVFVEGEQTYLKSNAVIRLLARLPGLWPLVSDVLSWIPRVARDVAYDWVAGNCYTSPLKATTAER